VEDGIVGTVQLVAEHEMDKFQTPIPRSIRIVFEVVGDTLSAATTVSNRAADTIARILCFQAGGAYVSPRIIAAMDVTPGLDRREYHQWLYNVTLAAPTREIQVPHVEILAHSLGARDAPEREAVVRALKWYTDALTETNAIDRFFKAWIGLESIGRVLDRRVHKDGWHECKKCLGELNKRKKDSPNDRGIRHLFSACGIDSMVFEKLRIARHKLVHADKPLSQVVASISPYVEVTVKALASGILTASAPPSIQASSREAYEPPPAEDGGADARLSMTLLTSDPNAWGELADKMSVDVDLVTSSLSTGVYAGNASIHATGDLPCEVEDYTTLSLRDGTHGVKLVVPPVPDEFHVFKVKKDRHGKEISRIKVR
jgi:hypothetical protein